VLPSGLVGDAVPNLGRPLQRLEQRRHRLEDLFRDGPSDEALAATSTGTTGDPSAFEVPPR